MLILRNHGTLVAGQSVAQAFSMMWHLEGAMRAQVDALASGQELTLGSTALAEKISGSSFNDPGEIRSNGTTNPLGFMEWPALLRMLDRIDPSYKL